MVTASSHNGRFGTAKHLGRYFPLEKAGHIDAERTRRNLYWCWDMGAWAGQLPGKTRMETAELYAGSERRYYDKRFQEALDRQNERHVVARHLDRIKTMDDWVDGKNTRCEESIYQIGDMDDGIDPLTFIEAVTELIGWLEDWSKEHGEPFAILDFAIHLDEASPHAQVRRVWQYQDENGVWCIGQNKALEAAGVELPEPDKKIGPKNNRKITFDRMVRAKWIGICEEHGYEIQRTPGDNDSHLPKDQAIALRKRKKELAAKEKELEERQGAMDARQAGLDERDQVVQLRERAVQDGIGFINEEQAALAAEKAELDQRERAVKEKEAAAAANAEKAAALVTNATDVVAKLSGLKGEMDEKQRERLTMEVARGHRIRDTANRLGTEWKGKQDDGAGPSGPGE